MTARGRTTPGTNAGSFRSPLKSAPGPAAQLADAPGTSDDLDDRETQEALAYLRSVLDREPAGPSPLRSVPTLKGDAMPALTFTHRRPFDPRQIAPVTQDHGAKPMRGLWLTVADASAHEPNPWERFIDTEEFRGGSAGTSRTAIRLRPEARIACIESLEDFDALCDECPNEPDWDQDWRDAFGTPASRPLDWSKVAATYDAIWVSQDAIGESKNADWSLDDPRAEALSMWDVESVLVFSSQAVDMPASTAPTPDAPEPHHQTAGDQP